MWVIATLLAAVVAVTIGSVIAAGAMTTFITLGLTVTVNIMQGG